VRLTKVQLRVLKTMVEYETGVIVSAHSGSAFFRKLLGTEDGKRVRSSTMFALFDKGLVNEVGDPAWRWRDISYEISDAGRDAIRSKKG